MRDFAREFYLSPAWRRVRSLIFKRDFGLCRRCGKPGEIVHHVIELSPENICDANITINEDNLILLCRECHALEHGEPFAAEGLTFDEEGNIIAR